MSAHPKEVKCVDGGADDDTDKRDCAGDVIQLWVGPDHGQEKLGELKEAHEGVVPAVEESCIVVAVVMMVHRSGGGVGGGRSWRGGLLDVFLHDLGDDEVERPDTDPRECHPRCGCFVCTM